MFRADLRFVDHTLQFRSVNLHNLLFSPPIVNCFGSISSAAGTKILFKNGARGGGFVMSSEQADQLIKIADGDVSKLEDLLGFDRGYLGTNPVRVDIDSPSGLRMPSGNELGANNYWEPGGYTSGGVKEAVIDPAPSGTYIVNNIE